MKRFHFALDSALQWRETRAEQEKQALETLRGEADKLEQARQQVQDAVRGAADLLAMAQAVDAAELARFADFENAMRAKEARLAQEQLACSDRVVLQQRRCVEADRDHQLVQRLKEKQHSAWRQLADREEEQAASDSYLAGWTRNMRRS